MKGKGKNPKQTKPCPKCGKQMRHKSEVCRKCFLKERRDTAWKNNAYRRKGE